MTDAALGRRHLRAAVLVELHGSECRSRAEDLGTGQTRCRKNCRKICSSRPQRRHARASDSGRPGRSQHTVRAEGSSVKFLRRLVFDTSLRTTCSSDHDCVDLCRPHADTVKTFASSREGTLQSQLAIAAFAVQMCGLQSLPSHRRSEWQLARCKRVPQPPACTGPCCTATPTSHAFPEGHRQFLN